MRAFITVVGKDTVGILAKVSSICAKYEINITEVSQTILDDMFCMIMLADISNSTVGFVHLQMSLQNTVMKTASQFTQCTRIFLTQCIEYRRCNLDKFKRNS